VGQESEVGKEAGVAWEVDARVSGAAGWGRGIEEWMHFGDEAVALELGGLLFRSPLGFPVLRRVRYICCSGECGCYAGRQVVNCSR